MMIIRVLPIHVPPFYEGAYLKPLHWNHIWLMMIIWSDPSMFQDAVSPWSLHIYHYEAMQGQGPHFPPTRKATSHIHRGEGGKGVKMGTLHWGGGGGGACQTWIIYVHIGMLTHPTIAAKKVNRDPLLKNPIVVTSWEGPFFASQYLQGGPLPPATLLLSWEPKGTPPLCHPPQEIRPY